jgi:serine protease Do
MNGTSVRTNLPDLYGFSALAVVAVGATLTMLVSHGCARQALDTKAEGAKHAQPAAAAAAGAPAPRQDYLGIERVAEQAMPAVVSVASTHVPEARMPDLPFDDPFFRRFFGPGGPSPFSLPKGGPQPMQHGLGSGVIVSGNVILTNAHVVEGAKTLVVTTQDRRNLTVEVAGSDPKSDLAVLRIKGDTKNLKSLDFADSDASRLGQVVLAIGNPFGVGETVTMGIVSAKGRADLGIADYEDFIQTDAAINPGNSGGALVDLDGHLLGIPTAILSRTGGYMGVGFAIPSNMARPIMQSLLDTGRVARSYLGVTIQDVNPALAKALGLKSTQGVLISDVEAGGPSAQAGLQRGDVVLSIDGKPMTSSGMLRNTVAAAGVGKKVELEIWRKGANRKLSVTLGSMPTDKEPATGSPNSRATEPGPLGMTLAPLDAARRKQLKVPDSVKSGVVVSDVETNGKAYDAGIRSGDVVVELGGTPVTSPQQLKELWEKSFGVVAALIAREGRTLYLTMEH